MINSTYILLPPHTLQTNPWTEHTYGFFNFPFDLYHTFYTIYRHRVRASHKAERLRDVHQRSCIRLPYRDWHHAYPDWADGCCGRPPGFRLSGYAFRCPGTFSSIHRLSGSACSCDHRKNVLFQRRHRSHSGHLQRIWP